MTIHLPKNIDTKDSSMSKKSIKRELMDAPTQVNKSIIGTEKVYQNDAEIYKQKRQQEENKYRQLDQYDHQRNSAPVVKLN